MRGAKTGLLAFSDGDIRPALRDASRSGLAEAEALVRRVHQGYVQRGYTVEAAGGSSLDNCYPPEDSTCVTILPGAELLCDRRFMLDRPSELPGASERPVAVPTAELARGPPQSARHDRLNPSGGTCA